MVDSNILIVNNFVEYLLYQKRQSLHTVKAYGSDLVSFFTFDESFQGGIEVSNLRLTSIRRWLASLKDNNIDAKSINRKISTLRTFFNYQLKMGIISNSPMRGISNLKTPKRIITVIPVIDIQTLFNYVDFPLTWDGKTHELILHIFYNTGIRRDELINLKTINIDIHKKNIKVMGKGSKERVIPVSNSLIKMILKYLADKKNNFDLYNEEFLLVNGKGNKLYPKYVYNIVTMYLSAVSANTQCNPHILRHTFATHLLLNGASISAIKDLLGHNSLISTQIYTSNSITNLMKTHTKFHPKG